MSQLFIRDIMSPDYPILTPETELTDAIQQLQKHHLIGAPVVDEARRLVGFISEQQLLKPLLDSSYFCDGKNHLGELLASPALQVSPQTTVVDLATQMQSNSPKVYPVVAEQKVVGIVTRSQVVAALTKSYLSCAG
ncbi:MULTISPECIES: CBS domain-containing protein [unclassified Pseudoalteromonas]|uniref:CBS domain-containing protein n=1 Tax=unclassified Pseudoalteromonas TaxID=194690 RepID=UPI0030149D29